MHDSTKESWIVGLGPSQLLWGLPTKDLKDVFGEAVVIEKKKKARLDKRRVPKEWSRMKSAGLKVGQAKDFDRSNEEE